MDYLSIAALTAAFADWRTWFIIGVTLAGGIVRGFSGFGGALIFIPMVSAVLGPRVAVPTFYLSDLFSATPYGLAAWKKVTWREILPLILGSWLTQPLGAWLLVSIDPDIVRWGMAGMVAIMLALLVSGWRYHGEPHRAITFGVGMLAGFFAGLTGISGPFIIAYWLGSKASAETTRANIMLYYALSGISINIIFWLKGIFTAQIVFYALIVWPVYTIGLSLGSRLFSGTSDGQYRIAAYALIAFSVLVSLPLFDGLFR